jgi:ribosome-binding factor A
MQSRRTAKVAEAVREQVSTTILFGLKDPRVKNVTVTRVEVSPDLRSAKVYVSVMGDEKTQRLTLKGLESARGFLQAKLAERVQIRYTPILHFQLDQGVKRSIEASRLLREVLPPQADVESLENTALDDTVRDDTELDEDATGAGEDESLDGSGSDDDARDDVEHPQAKPQE